MNSTRRSARGSGVEDRAVVDEGAPDLARRAGARGRARRCRPMRRSRRNQTSARVEGLFHGRQCAERPYAAPESPAPAPARNKMTPCRPASINLTNQFLIAMPGMGDGTFAGTVVYLCEHTEKGALGLVINKPIDITLKSLFEKVELSLDRDDLAEVPVYFGGPVQTERGFVLHEPLGRRRGEGEPVQLVAEGRGRPRDDDQQGRARGDLERRRAEEGAGHARLQRLGRRPARGRDEQERLDQRRRRARHHLRHAGRASATTRRSRCSASTPACSARTRGTRECARGSAQPYSPPTPLLSRFRFRHAARRRRHRQCADAHRARRSRPSPPRAKRA